MVAAAKKSAKKSVNKPAVKKSGTKSAAQTLLVRTAARAWLMKSEPSVYSIDHLVADRRTLWTGVRNYQARNFMTQSMAIGDLALFYHSNADPPGIAGLMRISGTARPDPSQFDPKSEGYEPRASAARPIWFCVEVELVAKADRFISLDELRREPQLEDMELLRRGSRLSIQPVEPAALATLCKLGRMR